MDIRKPVRRRVLLITDVLAKMCGSERNVTQILSGLSSELFEIYLACFMAGPVAWSLRSVGHKIFVLHQKGVYTGKGLLNLLSLYRLVRREKIELIVSYHEASDVYGLILSKLTRVPIISSRRDMGFKTRFHYHLFYRFFGRFYDAVITVSNAVKNEVVRRKWFPVQKVVAIHNGVDLSAFEALRKNSAVEIRKELGVEDGHPLVGIVANFRKEKGIQSFIQAAGLISRTRPDVEFIVIGGDVGQKGHSLEHFRILANKLHLLGKMHFLGMRENVQDLVNVLDVPVLASFTEGFSNAILEFMASQKPVVATDVGGNPEAIIDGFNGFLVAPGDPQKLAVAILKILDDRNLATKFGTNGRKRVEEFFSLKRMLQNYEELFSLIIENRRKNICADLMHLHQTE